MEFKWDDANKTATFSYLDCAFDIKFDSFEMAHNFDKFLRLAIRYERLSAIEDFIRNEKRD